MNHNLPVKRSVEDDVTAWFRRHWFSDHSLHEFADIRGKLDIREKPRRSNSSQPAPHRDWSWRPKGRGFGDRT